MGRKRCRLQYVLRAFDTTLQYQYFEEGPETRVNDDLLHLTPKTWCIYITTGLLCFCRRAKMLYPWFWYTQQHNDPGKNKFHKSLIPVQAAPAAERRDCCVSVCQLQLCPPQHLRLFSPAKHASCIRAHWLKSLLS